MGSHRAAVASPVLSQGHRRFLLLLLSSEWKQGAKQHAEKTHANRGEEAVNPCHQPASKDSRAVKLNSRVDCLVVGPEGLVEFIGQFG